MAKRSRRSWYRERRRFVLDLIVLGGVGALIAAILISGDAAETFFAFARSHESWELDEVALVIGFVTSHCLAIFAFRRWQDASYALSQAYTDDLTGLYNRRRGWEIIDRELERARRYQRPLALIMFDLDEFKRINDLFGHPVGDEVLQIVARVAGAAIRETDFLIRWGGEEFVVVCPETGREGAAELADRIRRAIQNARQQDLPGVTASFGVTELQETDSFFTLMKRLDEQMYRAKAAGRNRVA